MTHPVTLCHNKFDINPILCAIHLRPLLNADDRIQILMPCACSLSGCPKFERIKKEVTQSVKELVAA